MITLGFSPDPLAAILTPISHSKLCTFGIALQQQGAIEARYGYRN
jgi:hypothetical protein